MLHYPFLYDSPLYLVQIALTLWMLVDAHRRGMDYYWFWIILFFQPFGAWAYFFLYKARELRGGHGFSGLFHRRPSLEELRRRAERSPTAAARLDLGERLVENGAYEEALPHIETMLAREPEHCLALFLAAACRRGLGHPDQAIPALQKLLGRHPSWGDYKAWRTLVEVRNEAADLDGALTSCRELVRVAPGLEHTCLLAEHLLQAGEKGEARKAVEQGLEEYRYLSGPSRRRDRAWVGKAKQLLREMG